MDFGLFPVAEGRINGSDTCVKLTTEEHLESLTNFAVS